MKMLGGDWSRGDLLALIGILVAVFGIGIAHIDTGKTDLGQPNRPSAPNSRSSTSGGEPAAVPATIKRVARAADVSSGQLNFGCEETRPAKTPEVFFGTNPADIQPATQWVQTDNAKGQNQQVVYDRDAQNQVKGVSAEGSITGWINNS